jgi:trimethylamine-N-oxide reductase cytochrome c-type subunit TorC
MVCAAVLMAGLGVAAIVSPAKSAGPQRYVSTVSPLLDASAGNLIGSLGPGTALDVLGQSGGATNVAVHGWSAQGANAVMFAAPDRHIVVLSGFTGHGAEGASQTVSTTVYHAVTVEGWVATTALVDDVETVWKSASGLYTANCGSCHTLPAVKSYSANQWPGIMKTQAVNAGLDPNDAALVTTYLQVQSGR